MMTLDPKVVGGGDITIRKQSRRRSRTANAGQLVVLRLHYLKGESRQERGRQKTICFVASPVRVTLAAMAAHCR
jgi:hypothetical protein